MSNDYLSSFLGGGGGGSTLGGCLVPPCLQPPQSPCPPQPPFPPLMTFISFPFPCCLRTHRPSLITITPDHIFVKNRKWQTQYHYANTLENRAGDEGFIEGHLQYSASQALLAQTKEKKGLDDINITRPFQMLTLSRFCATQNRGSSMALPSGLNLLALNYSL